MKVIWFGAYTPPGPSKYSVNLSDMDGENSNRSETGYMNRDRVRAGIYKLQLGWTNLTMEQVDSLLAAVSAETFEVGFYFGGAKSAEMYAGDRQIDLQCDPEDGHSYWNVSFNLVEV